MKPILKIAAVAVISWIVIVISCKKNPPANKPPVARAGPDQAIAFPLDYVLLDGSSSTDPDGNITGWQWTKLSGPASYKFIFPNSSTTTASNLTAGIYQFELRVTDNGGAFSTDTVQVTVGENHPPIANAGADISFSLPSPCTFPRIIELDGKGSSDPDNNITHYLWTKISGPSTGTLRTLINGRANLENIVVGQYVIELIVIDTKSLSSKDTIVINVEWQPKEYNLDLNINGIYNFIDNYQDCFYYYYYYPCSYYDYTTIEGKGNFSSSEQFSAYVFENADTVNSSDIHYTHLTLQLGNNNNIVTYGTCSINFKKLIQQGGGSFSGSMAINGGSAQSCNPNIFNGLPALLLSGSLDTTTHTINLNIKGRVYY